MLPHGTGQERPRRRLRRGRQGPRGRGGRRGRRRRGRPRGEDRGRLHRLRRRDRDARPDGQRRQARPGARPARPDAEPEDRHGHLRRRQGRHATPRAASSSTAPTAARTCTSRSARRASTTKSLLENYAALVEEIVRAKPAAAKGRYIEQITLTTTMGPGVQVDPSRIRGIVEELEEAGRPGLGFRPQPVAEDRGSRAASRRGPAEVALGRCDAPLFRARLRAGSTVSRR